jgi:hypothetical protein
MRGVISGPSLNSGINRQASLGMAQVGVPSSASRHRDRWVGHDRDGMVSLSEVLFVTLDPSLNSALL